MNVRVACYGLCTALILSHRMQTLVDTCEFKISLVYTASFRPHQSKKVNETFLPFPKMYT